MDSAAIQEWILTNIVPLILLVIGCTILFSAKKGNWSRTMDTAGIAIVALIFIGGAGALIVFGEQLAGVIF